MVSYFRTTASECTVPQVSKAARATKIFLTFFWILLLVLSICLVFYQSAPLIGRLSIGGKIAHLILINKGQLDFPAVTICNLNAYKKSAVFNLPIFSFFENVTDQSATRKTREVKRDKRQVGCNDLLSDQFYWIKNVWSGLSLDSINGTLIHTTYKTEYSQQWRLVPVNGTNNRYYMVNRASARVLQEAFDGEMFEADMRCWDPRQYFLFQLNSSLCSYEIVVASSSSSLYPISNSTSSIIYSANSSFGNKWMFEIVEPINANDTNVTCQITFCHTNANTYYKIRLTGSRLLVGVRNASLTPNASIEQNFDTNSDHQLWLFVKIGMKTFKIYNKLSGLLMTVQSDYHLVQTDEDLSQNDTQEFLIEEEYPSCTIRVLKANSKFFPGNFLTIAYYSDNATSWILPYWYSNRSLPVTLNQRFIFERTDHSTSSYQSTMATSSTKDFQSSSSTSTSVSTSTPASASTTKNAVHSTQSTLIKLSSQTSRSAANDALKINQISQALNLQNNLDSTTVESKLKSSLAYLMNDMTSSERSKLGYQFSEVFNRCTFNGQKCQELSDIVQWNDISSGNCFTFNHKTSKKAHATSKPGRENGLNILFNVMSNEYLSSISSSSGVKVIIQHPNATVFTDSQGDVVSGSSSADFALKYNEIHRNDGCNQEQDGSKNVFVDDDYSYENCIRSCYQMRIINVCGCGDPTIPMPAFFHTNSECGIEKIICVQNVYDESLDKGKTLNCTCRQPCSENLFSSTKTVAALKLPGNLNQQQLSQFVSINVYFQTLSYIVYEETDEYSYDKFFFDFAGIVGIYLAASFVTIFEFIFLLFIGIRCFFTQMVSE